MLYYFTYRTALGYFSSSNISAPIIITHMGRSVDWNRRDENHNKLSYERHYMTKDTHLRDKYGTGDQVWITKSGGGRKKFFVSPML